MMNKTMCSLAWLLPLILLTACSGGGGGGGNSGGGVIGARLGDPVAGLPAAQLASFERGKVLMSKRFKPSEGLGPFYNATSCQACHQSPVVGGAAPLYRNNYLAALGFPGSQQPVFTAPLPSIVLPSFALPGFSNERPALPAPIPGFPLTTTQRNPPPMFGTGLFEFVSDQTIIAMSDPDDADGDGISGRYNRDAGLNVGRFGFKSQANNIESFIRGAAQNQMGMTTNPVLGNAAVVSLRSGAVPQVAGGQNAPTTDPDAIPDPEISTNDFADIITFSKFLAPPERKPDTESSLRGEALFASVGCTSCHVPSIPSSYGDLYAYTDLLIHDMGPALADGISMGVPQASTLAGFTTENEWRTQPLWGVAESAPFLHDGRADTLDQAIRMHGGEADAIRMAFESLSQQERDDIIAFLEVL